jgi:hypothetical protein
MTYAFLILAGIRDPLSGIRLCGIRDPGAEHDPDAHFFRKRIPDPGSRPEFSLLLGYIFGG